MPVAQVGYAINGRIASTTNRAGETTSYTYADDGGVDTVRMPDSLSARTTCERDDAQRLVLRMTDSFGDSVAQVEGGAALVGQAGRTMQEIVQAVEQVTQILGDISVASAQQSSGIESVSRAVQDMDAVTHENAALVEQAATAAHALAEQARQLKDVVDEFKV